MGKLLEPQISVHFVSLHQYIREYDALFAPVKYSTDFKEVLELILAGMSRFREIWDIYFGAVNFLAKVAVALRP